MILKRIFNALLAAHDHFIGLAIETDGRLCDTGREVRGAFEELKKMDAHEVFGSLSKTAAGSIREIAQRMGKAKSAFEFADAVGDLAALNLKLIKVSADWANAERRQAT